MKYSVTVKEVWSRTFEIEADSLDSALEQANELIAQGEDGDFDYSDTMDQNNWTVFNYDKDEYEQ